MILLNEGILFNCEYILTMMYTFLSVNDVLFYFGSIHVFMFFLC